MTSLRHEEQVSLQVRYYKPPRQVDLHEERYPVREGMTHVGADLLDNLQSLSDPDEVPST